MDENLGNRRRNRVVHASQTVRSENTDPIVENPSSWTLVSIATATSAKYLFWPAIPIIYHPRRPGPSFGEILRTVGISLLVLEIGVGVAFWIFRGAVEGGLS